MMTEPRYTLRTWFDPAFVECKVNADNLKKRDGVNAMFEADYEMSENNLKALFLSVGLDIIFVIKKIRVEAIVRGWKTIGYRHFIGVQPVCINKRDALGDILVLATEMVGKAIDEIRRVLRQNVDAGSATVFLRTEQPEVARLGEATLVFGDTATVRFDEYV